MIYGLLHFKKCFAHVLTLVGSQREVFQGHAEINEKAILSSKTVFEYDDRFTRRLFGYESVRHYYRDGSSDLYVSSVAVPLLCVQARDDPISVPEAIPFEGISANPFVSLVLSNKGGHIGWFSGLFDPEPWSSLLFLKFFDDMFQVRGATPQLDPLFVSVWQ